MRRNRPAPRGKAIRRRRRRKFDTRRSRGGANTALGGARVIAIDGPAGAGKSTIARAVAERLGWDYLDTGALYRAGALAAIEGGADLDDSDAVAGLVRSADIALRGAEVELNGVDVSSRIRDADVTAAAARISAYPEVRAALIGAQRHAAGRGNVVIEGRDIGTAVVPEAGLKIWLDAALEERARRRLRQRGAEETPTELESTAALITARDTADSSRSASPLARAPDALVIDSTDKDAAQVTDEIVDAARRVFDD